MLQLLFGGILLSLIHAAIPNHWLPVVAIGKAEKWPQRETLFVAALSGLAHTLSTVLVGIAIGIIGINLSRNYTFITEKLAPLFLILLGLIYVMLDILKNHKHEHTHLNKEIKNRSKWAIISSLIITMFFSPCLELEAYYLQAVSEKWTGVLLLSVIYVVITVSAMILLVFLASKGVRAIQSHFLDHHSKLLSGIVLILLGIFALFVHF
jgi:nickel/cobalt transporter (NicO) family protein